MDILSLGCSIMALHRTITPQTSFKLCSNCSRKVRRKNPKQLMVKTLQKFLA